MCIHLVAQCSKHQRQFVYVLKCVHLLLFINFESKNVKSRCAPTVLTNSSHFHFQSLYIETLLSGLLSARCN